VEKRTLTPVFLLAWGALLIAKLALAAHVPLFVDEAFYWLEGRHLAPAYSDLPGLTAWLARFGTEIGGEHAIALRAPFVLLGALVPLLVARIAARELGPVAGAQAGLLALALPLAGTLGILALPDVPLTLAALLCLDAASRALRGVDARAAAELAFGLALGALAHYRFAAVAGIGLAALLALPRGRAVLRDPRIVAALAVGALAWSPLVAWNVAHAHEGLHFQLVDRHPWAFDAGAWRFVLVQAALATPLLFVASLVAGRRFLRVGTPDGARYVALAGLTLLLAFFVLGFFADRERASFHWPLPGTLALLSLAPAVLATWPRWLRVPTVAFAAAGGVAAFGLYAALATGAWRALDTGGKWYPGNFAGWDELAREVDAALARMPPHTVLVAGDFKIAATLGFLRADPAIRVLDHPLNRHHGRAPQLSLWETTVAAREELGRRPVLLVEAPTHLRLSERHARQLALCAWAGALPVPRTLDLDDGRKRFELFALPAHRAPGACAPPPLAAIAFPEPGARIASPLVVRGWATRDATGLAGVDIEVDGKFVARATYGLDAPFVGPFLEGRSRDPNGARVGFEARVDLASFAPGRHRLDLVLRAPDGSEHPGPRQSFLLERRP
jgi:hypothetical protein